MRIRLSAAFLLLGLAGAAAQAPAPGWQATPWADSVMLQSELRFDLESPDGTGVSDQQWARFLTDTILTRFPDGLTVLNAESVGKAGTAGARLVMIVHPNTPDAATKLGEIRAAFAQRFGGAKVFHLDFPVRVTN
ncbi:DUF3574 domain-containing protein [Aquabacter sp. CN5-332]|uniref:DUF3574 domain-containing protein n=1 Tax=Aquabacter sp. CN5-332 TaxID=3156608 RepID=UPI0032B5FE74